jgi:hypothetical protein
MTRLNTRKHRIDDRTYYLLDSEGGGMIVSTRKNLDGASDAVAQDIGFPIDHGSWQEPDAMLAGLIRLERMEDARFVNFTVAEDAFGAWKASL